MRQYLPCEVVLLEKNSTEVAIAAGRRYQSRQSRGKAVAGRLRCYSCSWRMALVGIRPAQYRRCTRLALTSVGLGVRRRPGRSRRRRKIDWYGTLTAGVLDCVEIS